ncbi:penicillin-binding protein activator [Candidatus Enterovibrio altilux]|uniref:LppC putative lipoprotein n=1 Tax=Candidatus Enterovibrio altilux TaxID=1927128 RepID=A0A291B7K3_9GAMM|nr:penicillin-binding protein activator [Candidatus Enterovibrio luxaltus]ATF08978.1 LppC putative lipoprotein [Candidatus Enterovibrio luxaltus]
MRKITHKYKSISRVIFPIALALALSACVATSPSLKAPLYDITAPTLESSKFYLLKAEISVNKEKADWYLLALKALITEKQFPQASALVSHLAKLPLMTIQLSEWQLNRAVLLQQKGQFQAAIDSLNFSSTWKLPTLQYQRYYLLKGKLYEQINNPSGAVLSYTEASSYLSDTFDKQQNWVRVWNLLVELSPSKLHSLSANSNTVLSGWAELVALLRQHAEEPVLQHTALNIWLATNPEHPANFYLPDNYKTLQTIDIVRPNRIAVLLPLSDKFVAQGEAIRNGFIQKLLDDNSGESQPAVMFYDTNGMAMPEIVAHMQNDGIQFVIGPLQKDNVDAFLNASHNTFPMLALNFPRSKIRSKNICFFTLSPEQEAKQAALHIAQNNHHYPLVIAPNNKFGHRVSSAFSIEWQSVTGKIPEIKYFENRDTMQETVQQVFGLTESQGRIQQINQILGLNMASEQRSRRDIDAVYLVANSGELSLLKPFIEVAINPNVNPPKFYASSHSNHFINGIREVGELRGIEFSDVPLLVEHNNPTTVRFHQLWPELNNSMIRLYALGMDAYSLIKVLPQMKALPEYRYQGQSGELSLGEQCVVNRVVSWAMYEDQGIISIR